MLMLQSSGKSDYKRCEFLAKVKFYVLTLFPLGYLSQTKLLWGRGCLYVNPYEFFYKTPLKGIFFIFLLLTQQCRMVYLEKSQEVSGVPFSIKYPKFKI